MDASFNNKIVEELKRKYRFRKVSDKWMQEGVCPECGEKELYCAAVEPKVVTCSRSDKCGFRDTVKGVLPELFQDWSKRVAPTEENPNATADAYLLHERGINLMGLRSAYSQETYFDRALNAGSATVRFPLPGGAWWERIIDRPGRFGKKKANIPYGAKIGGHCWCHPEDDFAALAAMDEIWIAEGIFDALALRQNFKRLDGTGRKAKATAVSAMSCNTWPEHFLTDLRKAINDGPEPKHRPRLIFAFDVGAAGVKFTRKFTKQAEGEGWQAGAAQVRPDGEGGKVDWNDLWLLQMDHRPAPDEDDTGPLSEKKIEEYLWNGEVTCASTAQRKARLIYQRKLLASFNFRFENRIYWASAKADEDGGIQLNVDEVANCAPRLLYMERDNIIDETNYFVEITFPFQATQKARFSNTAISAPGEFNKRLLAFGGMWSGAPFQLASIIRHQLKRLKIVNPIKFTGYAEEYDAWVLGDIAVRGGRVEKLNEDKYFDFGKAAVKMRSEEHMLAIHYNPDEFKFDWVKDMWEAWGPRGFVALAFFTLSLFAVQIRKAHQSLGFLEVHGEAGSGKTTLLFFLWKLLGRPGHEGNNPNLMTRVALARSLIKVSGLPVGIIENQNGDPAEMAKNHAAQFEWAELLTLFNGGSPRSTGMKTSGGETYEPQFLGALYLMHNEPVQSIPAVMQRIMSMRVGKDSWTSTSQAAARRIERYDPRDASGWIVHVTRQADRYLPFFLERTDYHLAEMKARSPDVANDRIVLCHSQLAAGVDCLRGLIPKHILPDEWLDQTVDFVDQMAALREKVSGAEHSVVEKFWGIFDYLSLIESGGADREVGLNMHRKSDEFIAVNIPHFMKVCRDHGQVPPREDELKKHLKSSKNRKFIKATGVNTPSGKVAHCWIFERPLSERTVI